MLLSFLPYSTQEQTTNFFVAISTPERYILYPSHHGEKDILADPVYYT
ncbi:MAG: hypothetical protein IPI18_09960 [Saprospiraceae bacterium]|nr:hypothetical protein [Saprospiraceae bacterium]